MIEKIVIITFIVQAIFSTMQEGMIFEILGGYFERKLGEFWCKPVSCCPVCMTPYYGSAAYWLIYNGNITEWVLVILGSMGLNKIISTLSPN